MLTVSVLHTHYYYYYYYYYTGTKPPMSAVMKQVRELDYDLVESEHRALLQVSGSGSSYSSTVYYSVVIVVVCIVYDCSPNVFFL